ncbi:MAG: class I SAM-dependent methyltransferase [Proteobacteria bacterium]|nr:class I SAM-dependent methyltransferase [Pseudomonadota bacterium]MBI3497181.1 class I SAM-dependent methyltransferase [Pseudomonadota bacterium]
MTVKEPPVTHGDFTELATDYALYRPGYDANVRAALIGLLGAPPTGLDAVDVGAGTGIWTRMLAAAGFRSIIAVEPNAAMRAAGTASSAGTAAARSIAWREGSGEATGLADASADLLTMASSFHWVDFARGTAEFRRVLRTGGWCCALWNPRQIEESPLLTEIEAELGRLGPEIERISSGRSGVTEQLGDRLRTEGGFSTVVYLEGRHVEIRSREAYIGVWRSVNDIRVQLGPERFARFLAWLDERLANVPEIATPYLTRAWAARNGTG